MGQMIVKEGSGGAQFEVVQPTTPSQLVAAGELERGVVVYEAESKMRVDANTILQPGKSYGKTVQAEYGR